MNYFTARAVTNGLNHETEAHRIAAGKSIYGNADKGVSVNHDVYELVGLGVDVQDIISGKFDKTLLNNKIKEASENVKEYKKLKLGL